MALVSLGRWDRARRVVPQLEEVREIYLRSRKENELLRNGA